MGRSTTRIAVTAVSGQLGSEIVNATVEIVGKERLIGLAGIYEGIGNGAANNESDFAVAAGREHRSWREYFDGLRTGTR